MWALKIQRDTLSPRAPGILHWPGRVSAGAVVDDAVSTMDVLPTALAVADEVERRELPAVRVRERERREPLLHDRRALEHDDA